MEIAMERIDILFDLNGGTLNSGDNFAVRKLIMQIVK